LALLGRSVGVASKFALGALPGVLVGGWLNVSLYGVLLHSGYDDFGWPLASPDSTIVARYARWLVESHTAFPLAGLLALLVCPRDRRGLTALMLAIAAASTAVYLARRPMDDWRDLRFLLPAVALALVLSGAAAAAVADRVHRHGAAIFCCLLAVVLGSLNMIAANRRLAFSLDALEQRFRDTGILVRDRLPPNAALFTVGQSGTVRFYSDKEAIRWDAVDPAELDLALAWLRDAGYRPYVLIERTEESAFQRRFEGISFVGPLEWPPIFDVSRLARIFDPDDRARYLAGETIRTEYVGER
jgi:uncharacterized membrane protein YfcA